MNRRRLRTQLIVTTTLMIASAVVFCSSVQAFSFNDLSQTSRLNFSAGISTFARGLFSLALQLKTAALALTAFAPVPDTGSFALVTFDRSVSSVDESQMVPQSDSVTAAPQAATVLAATTQTKAAFDGVGQVFSLPFTDNETTTLKELALYILQGGSVTSQAWDAVRVQSSIDDLQNRLDEALASFDGAVAKLNQIPPPLQAFNGRSITTTVNPDSVNTNTLDVSGSTTLSSATISNNLTVSNDLTVLGETTFSGTSIFTGIASTSALFGAGLSDCDTQSSDKLLWHNLTGTFSCGIDQSGGGGGGTLQVRELDEFNDCEVATISFHPAHFNLSASNSEDVIVKLDWTNGPASRTAAQTISGFWTFAGNASVSNTLETYSAATASFQITAGNNSQQGFTLQSNFTGSGASESLRILNGAGTNLVTIASNGNVGIGTTAPNRLLTVAGTASVSGDAWFDSNASVSANFEVGGTASISNALYIDSSGKIGIGMSTPVTALEVNGTARGALEDKGGQVYNVLAYGVVAGDVDTAGANSTAILALLATVNTAGGGTIYFPPGTYRFDSQ